MPFRSPPSRLLLFAPAVCRQALWLVYVQYRDKEQHDQATDGKTMMTSLDGVFAAGDIVRGASLVVWAIRDGRDVAAHMHGWMRARALAAAA